MKPDSHIAPFFTESITPVFGLNHLGIRNASEDLFTTLLPGLNGVTLRVRYYSFYCWLTGKFKETFTGSDRTNDEYRLFIRKAEILLALIQVRVDHDLTGIPGIDYARNLIDSGGKAFDLKRCAYNPDSERGTRNTYWANPGGILAQYYSSSMKDLALLPSLKGFPYVSVPSQKDDDLPEGTVTGQSLADAFAESIGQDAEDLFLSCTRTSRATLEDLDSLASSFKMKAFGDIGEERSLLMDMLDQKDYPDNQYSDRTLRNETIRLFLRYCMSDRKDGSRDAREFPRQIYSKVLAGELSDECSLGWYAYHLNDEWQYLSSVVFSCVLASIEDEGWVSIDKTTDGFAMAISDMITGDGCSMTLGDVCALIGEGKTSKADDDSLEAKAGIAIYDMLRYYCDNRNRKETISAFRAAFPEFRRDDFFGFMEELNDMQETDFKDFVKGYITTKLIYRHHTVSLMKFCQTGVASNKFLLEDGYIQFIQNPGYSHTAPRIDSLIYFLSDLNLLNEMKPSQEATERYSLGS